MTERRFFAISRSTDQTITDRSRDDTVANREIGRATLDALFLHAQARYGEGLDLMRYGYLAYGESSRSMVAPLLNNREMSAVWVGCLFESWEETFYEVAHECVHFPGPVVRIAGHSCCHPR